MKKSAMIERAARAVYAHSPQRWGDERVDGYVVHPARPLPWAKIGDHMGKEIAAKARSALVAALDPDDEALVRLVAERMECDPNFGSVEHMARAAIAALRAHAAPPLPGE